MAVDGEFARIVVGIGRNPNAADAGEVSEVERDQLPGG
jgi:hypothetical protein